MTTPAEANKAPTICQHQRFALRHLAQVDKDRATEEERKLFARLQACKTPDEYDRALGDKAVSAAFCRGVFFFSQEAK